MSKASFIKELSIPAIAAPMFLISGPKLVIECCKNGIVGTFPALNQRTSEGFEQWLIEIKTELENFEKEFIARKLEENNQNLVKTARALNVDKAYLTKKAPKKQDRHKLST